MLFWLSIKKSQVSVSRNESTEVLSKKFWKEAG